MIDKRDVQAVLKVLKSDFLTQGPCIEQFEAALARYTGARYATVFSSGTAALHAAYFSAGIEAKDEVITSPITFAATANAALMLGAIPRFSDVEPDTGNLDVTLVETAIGPKTKAIIPVHYAGHPVDMELLGRVAKRHDITVIEDACHAIGAEYKIAHTVEDTRIKVGSCAHSDMTVFSFHAVKQITTAEGGAVTTNSDDLYQKLMMFRTHGITKDKSRFECTNCSSHGDWYHEMQFLGFNYRMSDLQAALGSSQLKKVDFFVGRRREIAAMYDKLFLDYARIQTPPERTYARSSYHLYPIRLNRVTGGQKKTIFADMRQRGLGVQVHYIPVYLHPYYQRLGYEKGLCPNAELFYEKEVSIPLYPALSDPQVEAIARSVKEAINGC